MLAEHQLVAAERALELLRFRGGVLLADDVGLGKSFVAAAVMQRWSGGLSARLELIVPAALVEQWRETLASFAISARILTHDAILRERFVPRPRDALVVVDEAHAFRNPATQRYAALARRTAGAKTLLVTATPICNSLRDLEALVSLIARDDLLADRGVPSIERAFATRDPRSIEGIVAALVIRRDRSVLPESLRFGVLDRSVVRHPILDARAIDDLRFPLAGEHAILRRFLWRRLESSEAALAESLRRQIRYYQRALACIAAGRTLPKREYRRAFAHEEDHVAFQEILFWDLFAPAGESDPRAIREEMTRLELLLAIVRDSPCEKRRLLVDLLAGEREPALIFTGSAATARDLAATLRCALITSRERSRDAVLHAFRAGHIDCIVSTDMSAEGLNLQRAGLVVHYDIPWNPVRLDQRNGRAHRIGQQRESVRAIYFLPISRETGIVETIARKNRIRKRALSHQQPGNPPTQQPTLRPRLTKTAAFFRLQEAAERAHLTLPDKLARKHTAGIELLMHEMSGEYLDRQRLDELLALIDEQVAPRCYIHIMSTAPILTAPSRLEDPDQRVILNDIDWRQFETFLAIRGDRAGVRVTYLEGQLEIMSPSQSHEMLAKLIARLLEAWADEKELVFEGYKSMTMRSAPKLRGIEPDECYAVGASKESPDLAVEVIWTHGGIDKPEVYRGLGVREVWIWKKEELRAYELRSGAYVEISESVVIPGLAPSFIREFLDCETQTEAVRKMRAVLRK